MVMAVTKGDGVLEVNVDGFPETVLELLVVPFTFEPAVELSGNCVEFGVVLGVVVGETLPPETVEGVSCDSAVPLGFVIDPFPVKGIERLPWAVVLELAKDCDTAALELARGSWLVDMVEMLPSDVVVFGLKGDGDLTLLELEVDSWLLNADEELPWKVNVLEPVGG